MCTDTIGAALSNGNTTQVPDKILKFTVAAFNIKVKKQVKSILII